MNLTLSIASEALDAEDLQELTRDVCMKINKELDANAELLIESNIQGARSVGIESIGSLVLSYGWDVLEVASIHLFATALLALVGSFFKMEPTIEMRLKQEDGRVLVIKREHLSPEQLNETSELVKNLLGSSK
jgi:hypothetical protein